MKIKSIAAICKKNKNIAIFERYSDDGDILTQYIGDGSAVYPVVGLPQLDKESLLTIFDVPEKDRDNYFVKTLGVPVGISFEDTDETERHVEREGISIIYSGRTLKPIHTTRGRLRFTDDDGNAADPAPFPSMVVIYNGERVKE